MVTRKIKIFITVSGTLLLLTGAIKLLSSIGSAHILQKQDPIFSIPFRVLFLASGFVEVMVAGICLVGKDLLIQIVFILWLSTSFAVYRLGLFWIAYQMPCRCLGNLTDALRISPHFADLVMKFILGYLLIGSCMSLSWLLRQNLNLVASRSKMKVVANETEVKLQSD